MSAATIAQLHLASAQDDLSAFLRREEHLHTPMLLQAALAAVERARAVLVQCLREDFP